MNLCLMDTSSESFSAVSYRAALWEAKRVPTFDVRAVRERQGLWVAQGNDIPGLNIEADSLIDLVAEIREWAPGLLIDNGILHEGDAFNIVVHSAGTTTRIYS